MHTGSVGPVAVAGSVDAADLHPDMLHRHMPGRIDTIHDKNVLGQIDFEETMFTAISFRRM
jgi:hypothetical protein